MILSAKPFVVGTCQGYDLQMEVDGQPLNVRATYTLEGEVAVLRMAHSSSNKAIRSDTHFHERALQVVTLLVSQMAKEGNHV